MTALQAHQRLGEILPRRVYSNERLAPDLAEKRRAASHGLATEAKRDRRKTVAADRPVSVLAAPILEYMQRHPKSEFTATQLARALGGGVHYSARAVGQRLVVAGLVVRKVDSNFSLYQIARRT